MNILRNILAVVLGLILGSMVNMGIILISGDIIPPPAGSDLTTMEGLTAAMGQMGPKHFLMPFLAHALGTFVGALVAMIIAFNRKRTLAYTISGIFFVGGLINVIMLPAPLWFEALDLIVAYVPMAWLASKMVKS